MPSHVESLFWQSFKLQICACQQCCQPILLCFRDFRAHLHRLPMIGMRMPMPSVQHFIWGRKVLPSLTCSFETLPDGTPKKGFFAAPVGSRSAGKQHRIFPICPYVAPRGIALERKGGLWQGISGKAPLDTKFRAPEGLGARSDGSACEETARVHDDSEFTPRHGWNQCHCEGER